jgi:ribosomal protein S27AE
VLVRAEHLAEQAVCGRCGVYGVLRVVASRLDADAHESERQLDGESLKVECRKCGHQWLMGARASD